MARTNMLSDNQSHNTLTRRAALQGTAAAAAMALPAGAAVAESITVMDFGTAPHVAWWRELCAIRADADVNGWPEDAIDRECALEDQIATTSPATLEAVAIVAALIVAGNRRLYPDGVQGEASDERLLDPEALAGDTLARALLDRVPADVLRRAGLAEGVA